MKWGIVTFSASTIVLACSAVYFSRVLAQERERNAAATAEAAQAAATPAADGPEADGPELASPRSATPVAAAVPSAAAQSAAAASAAPSTAPAAEGPDALTERRRARNREQAEEFLRRYDNPETRAALIEQHLEILRRNYALLRPKLDLDTDRWNRFLKLMNEQHLDYRVRSARCITDTTCIRMDFGDSSRHQQAVAELIGDKNMQELQAFRRRGSQPDTLAKFQARLGPRLALSSTQVDELASALADESSRTRREIESRGHESSAFVTRYGVVVYSRETKTVEERMASAAASIDRMRDRAGTLLSGEQLTIFNQTQDDALIMFRPHARLGIAVQSQGYDL